MKRLESDCLLTEAMHKVNSVQESISQKGAGFYKAKEIQEKIKELRAFIKTCYDSEDISKHRVI